MVDMSTRRSKSIAKELGAAKLGDARRSARLEHMTEAVMERPGTSLPEAMGSEAALEGAYRFLNNDDVEAGSILAPHVAATVDRIAAAGVAYCISDTTEFRFGGAERDGMGPLQGGGSGFLAHIALAVAADGSRLPLGILGIETIVRHHTPKRRRGTKKSRRGESERGGPREVFDRAVEVLGESCAELELGRAFSAYAEYEERTGRAATADDLRERAQAIRTRAIHGEAAASAAEL